MSHTVSIEISDEAFAAINANAAASGVSAAQLIATTLEHQFSNGNGKEAPKAKENKLPPTLTLNELMAFLKTLPKLGDDADDFARDVEEIRKSFPPEKSAWD